MRVFSKKTKTYAGANRVIEKLRSKGVFASLIKSGDDYTVQWSELGVKYV